MTNREKDEALSRELEELGKRAIASEHFRWMAGMLTTAGERVVHVYDGVDGVDIALGHRDPAGPFRDFDEIEPDFTDPATLGCLLHLVREAYTQPAARWSACVDIDEDIESFKVTVWPAGPVVKLAKQTRGETLGAALVAALEAAP